MGGTKLAEQPGLGELAQPLGILDVGLATRDLLDVPGVDQHALKPVLKDRPHGPPEHPGRFHHDLRHTERLEPIKQRQQARDGRRELRHMLLAPAVLRGHPHGRRDLLLVNIQRRRALNYRLHLASRNPIDKIVAQGPLRTNEVLQKWLWQQSGTPGRPTRQTKLGLTGTKGRIGVEGDPSIKPFSSARDRPPGQHN